MVKESWFRGIRIEDQLLLKNCKFRVEVIEDELMIQRGVQMEIKLPLMDS